MLRYKSTTSDKVENVPVNYGRKENPKHLKKVQDKHLEKTDSKELIQTFGSSPSLYEGIEFVMRATYEASVKLNVESVAESVISVYKLHNN